MDLLGFAYDFPKLHILSWQNVPLIILAGFADNSGDYAFNLNLARARAKTVAEHMRARGVFIDRIFSCGEELPVATNSSSSGRQKNRRVEVWLK